MKDDRHRWPDAIARDLADVESFGVDWPALARVGAVLFALALAWGWMP